MMLNNIFVNRFSGISHIRTTFLIIFLLLSLYSSGQHFQTVWSGNAYQPMTIIITEALLDGLNCEAGDEIAVFDINELGEEVCVGTSLIANAITPTSPIIITASKDDNLTSYFDGFIEGNSIIYKYWDISNSIEVVAIVATYNNTSPFVNVYTSLSTALVSLAGFSAINTSVLSDSGCSGDFIVPVIVNNVQDVQEFNLKLDYGNDNLSYFNYQDVHDSLYIGIINVSGDAGSIVINWTSADVISLPDDTLLKLIFQTNPVYSQTTNALVWDTINYISYYLNSNLDTLPCFFNNGEITIDADVGDAGIIDGNNLLCQGTLNETYSIDSLVNASSYIWELVPQISGTIVGNGPNITVDWFPCWSGIASLSVFGSNSCGDGGSSLLNITIEGNPSVYAGLDSAICFDDVLQLEPVVINYASVSWLSSGDGSFDDPYQLNASYSPGPVDIEIGQAILTIEANPINPCNSSVYDSLTLAIDNTVGIIGTPMGPENVNLATTPFSNYLIDEIENAYYYNWSLYPDGIGDIVEHGINAMVVWNAATNDSIAKIFVEVGNACGSELSDTLMVSISYIVGLWEKELLLFDIIPNPSTGIVLLKVNCNDRVDLIVRDIHGEIVISNTLVCSENSKTQMQLDLSYLNRGIYIFQIVNDDGTKTRKVVINK